jgi:hypothetical protein
VDNLREEAEGQAESEFDDAEMQAHTEAASQVVRESAAQQQSRRNKTVKEAALQKTRRDIVYKNAIIFLTHSLIYTDFCDSIRSGDTGRLQKSFDILMVMFQGSPKMKSYRYQTLDLKALRTRLWTAEMRELWLWNAVLNLSGQQGKGIAIDEFNEWVVRAVKDIYNPSVSMQSTKFTCETISPNVIALREAAKGVLRSSGAPTWGYNHARVDDKRDIELIVELLLKDDIFTFTPGRPSPITYKASRDLYMDEINAMTGSEGVVKKYVAKKVAHWQQAGIYRGGLDLRFRDGSRKE